MHGTLTPAATADTNSHSMPSLANTTQPQPHHQHCNSIGIITIQPANVLTNVTTQGSKTGKDNGYTMLFDIESFDYSYYNEGSEGLKLALVHHLDMPIMRQKG